MGWQCEDAQAGLAVDEGGVYGTYGTGSRPRWLCKDAGVAPFYDL